MKRYEVNVVLNKKDLNRFLIRHNYSRFGGIMGVIVSVCSFGVLGWFWQDLIIAQKCILIILGLMFTVIQPLLLLLKGQRQLKHKIFSSPFQYTFSQKGIDVRQEEYHEFFGWSAIKKRVITKDAIYVYMSAQGAFIIPKNSCKEQFVPIATMIMENTKKKK